MSDEKKEQEQAPQTEALPTQQPADPHPEAAPDPVQEADIAAGREAVETLRALSKSIGKSFGPWGEKSTIALAVLERISVRLDARGHKILDAWRHYDQLEELLEEQQKDIHRLNRLTKPIARLFGTLAGFRDREEQTAEIEAALKAPQSGSVH